MRLFGSSLLNRSLLNRVRKAREKYLNELDNLGYRMYCLLERKVGEGNLDSWFDYNSRLGLFEWTVYVKDDIDVKVVDDIASIHGLEFHSKEIHHDPYHHDIKWVAYTYYEKKK